MFKLVLYLLEEREIGLYERRSTSDVILTKDIHDFHKHLFHSL